MSEGAARERVPRDVAEWTDEELAAALAGPADAAGNPMVREARNEAARRLRERQALQAEVLALRRAVIHYEAGERVGDKVAEAIDRAFDWNSPELAEGRRNRDHERPELEAALRTGGGAS